MEYGIGSGRFLILAPGTPSGIGSFTLAIIGMAAFHANKAIRPFFFSYKLQAIIR